MPLLGGNFGGGGGGGLELIESKTIALDTTTVTFTGLDGDADGVYVLRWRTLATTGSAILYLRMNADATADCYGHGLSAATSTPAATVIPANKPGIGLQGYSNINSGGFLSGQATIYAKRIANTHRYADSKATANDQAGVSFDWWNGIGFWQDSTATGNVTSLVVATSSADQIKQNSVIELYKEVYA